MACATAKKDGSSRYANSIRARSTRLAGSVRERAIAPNSAKSFSPIANSIACRHAVMSSTLSANQSRKPRTHVGKCESSTYDAFHGIDVLASGRRSSRSRIVAGDAADRRLRSRRRLAGCLVELGRQGGDRWRFEDRSHGQLVVELAADARDQLGGEQRMAAELKEIVSDADPFHIE